jgi:hypothetical protein
MCWSWEILAESSARWCWSLRFSSAETGSAASTDELLLQRGKVGKLSVGMVVSDIWKLFPQDLLKGGFEYPEEGIPTPVIEIRLSRGQTEPSLTVWLGETGDHRRTIASGFKVRDRRFTTAAGIGPGMTIARLRNTVSGLTISSFEADTYLNSEDLRMSFNLDVEAFESDLMNGTVFKPVPELPGDIPIQNCPANEGLASGKRFSF